MDASLSVSIAAIPCCPRTYTRKLSAVVSEMTLFTRRTPSRRTTAACSDAILTEGSMLALFDAEPPKPVPDFALAGTNLGASSSFIFLSFVRRRCSWSARRSMASCWS